MIKIWFMLVLMSFPNAPSVKYNGFIYATEYECLEAKQKLLDVYEEKPLDYKMITHKVLRQADAVKDKILPIDFNGTKDALLTNINTRKEAEKVLQNEGVLILFPSGRIATKHNLSKLTKADDGEWKQWVSKLILKTKSPVLPIYFDGQNSQLYHIANKIGQTFRYSLCMYELKRKIGDEIYMYFGSLIPYENLAKIGDIKAVSYTHLTLPTNREV